MTEEHSSTKNANPKSGSMSFIEHLEELRKRLIRFFIVMIVCVLATYAFRKEILDLVRKPVDAPLKKYTAAENVKTPKGDFVLTDLASYDCACKEVKIDEETIISTEKPENTDDAKNTSEVIPVEATSDSEETNLDIEQVTVQASSVMESVKESINDFVIFFQVLLDKTPSPVFETEKHKLALGQDQQLATTFNQMPSDINLNCQCSVSRPKEINRGPHSSMVFIGLPELFFAQMKVAIFAGFFFAFPYLLIEIWGFVGPALYRSEKKTFWIFAISSYIFFIGGALFGYFIVFPYGFDFFLSLTQMGEIMPSLSIGDYLGFAVKLLLAFGFIFELPLATFILARMGVVTPELMIKQSRVAILIVFILSAMLTPPDPFTMMLMSGPLIILYIVSIGVCFVGVNRQKAAMRKQGIDMDDI